MQFNVFKDNDVIFRTIGENDKINSSALTEPIYVIELKGNLNELINMVTALTEYEGAGEEEVKEIHKMFHNIDSKDIRYDENGTIKCLYLAYKGNPYLEKLLQNKPEEFQKFLRLLTKP